MRLSRRAAGVLAATVVIAACTSAPGDGIGGDGITGWESLAPAAPSTSVMSSPLTDPPSADAPSADPPSVGPPLTDALSIATTGPAPTPEIPRAVPELPGGGTVMFPGRTLVALYGHPGAPALGALGQQDLPAAVERAERVAATYRGRVAGPVIPAFEIIATVATAGAGADGKYSARAPVSKLAPWVKAATDAGMYVILDLQPGRANLLEQANAYIGLLRQPNVGLAIDPEWKLGPGQRPLGQIGGVDADEVNGVISWLSRLTAANDLPQKVLVLHQFRLSMLRDEQRIVTGDRHVAVVIHMDGQGSPAAKNATWRSVIRNAPPGVHFGWKNFFANDKPMLTQSKTLARKPVPAMISYQ